MMIRKILQRLFRRPAVIFVPDSEDSILREIAVAEEFGAMVADLRRAQDQDNEGDDILVSSRGGKIYIRSSSGIMSIVTEVTPEHARQIGESLVELADEHGQPTDGSK